MFYMYIGKTVAGTTDTPIDITHLPTPKEEDIRFILEEIKHYLSPDISGRVEGNSPFCFIDL